MTPERQVIREWRKDIRQKKCGGRLVIRQKKCGRTDGKNYISKTCRVEGQKRKEASYSQWCKTSWKDIHPQRVCAQGISKDGIFLARPRLDIGLLGAMVDAPAAAILVGNNIFKEYKGAFTELYVHNELRKKGKATYYYNSPNSTVEIDFLLQNETTVCPIEVKAEENVKAKSLRTFIQNNPTLKGIRISMKGHCDQEWMVNLPLYDFLPYM